MSARNTQVAKVARKDRAHQDHEAIEKQISAEFGSPLVKVHSISELIAARRKDRAHQDHEATERRISAEFGSPLVKVHSISELLDFAGHGERLPCGCDANALLHEIMMGA